MAACDDLFSAGCSYSNTESQPRVPGIHFIWMETVRIMTINTANPSVCFVPGIRCTELIHWSFPRGFGESVWQFTEFISGSTGHCVCVYMLSVVQDNFLIAACNPEVVFCCSIIVSRVLRVESSVWCWDAISRVFYSQNRRFFFFVWIFF